MTPRTTVPRVALALRPTPVARMRSELGPELWVKRDDLTGSVLSGNKVRKLEYLLADAQVQGADVVFTCGGVQSNHCRATAIAARQLGLPCVVFLRVDDPSQIPAPTGNLLLDRLVGAEIRYISRADYARRREVMAEAAAGRNAYIIPEGGSNALGSLGYYDCIGELVSQLGEAPLTVVYAAGSGGTGAGLVAGVLNRALPWRVVGVNVCDDRAYFVEAIGAIVEDMQARFDLSFAFERESLEILDGYVGRGYAKSRPEELACLIALARAEGLVLDPVYTGKAWYGLTQTLARDAHALGSRIVFIHTGGVFGLFGEGTSRELSGLL
ncbi:MAG: D-cysteine desulfhydrase family protein [Polyangia bacterium]